ncbi:MAG: transglycosylase SLT domain-containing protein [Gemmatimonadetes bacterium]|nr:lytic transglycosylase domain-containing protein [Gemmatimonadota bacterium]NIQ54152.1 lytic transglycosylase domain-containing protein [Gemmatimonadota bacterium]NIU74346.1 transglycosylase SLT domain-containing protein [Gammaproteobacteria bacterium]NIX44353.1 transglycosylase SLT domain-containing protein [Gemmatimonadota bacterium]NIY08574.1 transglycosylase SLT domain-containing protein [Gemmatimonadota bacterium]
MERSETRRGGFQARARSLVRTGLLGVVAAGASLLIGTTYEPLAGPADPVLAVQTPPPPVADPAGFDMGWDLPNLRHERVDYWVERFTTVPEMREKFAGFLERAGRWAPPILERLEERGMPLDLIFLAMIESGFNPAATSPARAAGIWQFIAPTGERYGLAIDRAVDERRDPVRATDAALDYLQDLHDRFGSWYLAAAAYNTGENRVGRIMREETGSERARREADYYRIWDRLPSETRDYVPLMIAAARIAKDPRAYGFQPADLQPSEWDEVVVPPATPLIKIANSVGITVLELKELNPHFRIHRTPNDRDYAVRIPAGTYDRLAHLDQETGRAVSD